jgi:hypothetical protein
MVKTKLVPLSKIILSYFTVFLSSCVEGMRVYIPFSVSNYLAV